jgi:hypothetical protein
MTIEELAPLTNGLSVVSGTETLVCERAMVTPSNGDVDMAFWIAGTDYRPRLRLTRDRVSRWAPRDAARILSHVVVNAVTGHRRA